ncbi:MAG: hypothetical protein JJU34_12010 [Lunatimonas sp.]|uniref:CRISPR-associated endonuclease Cas6 n=1 Tax=Lunatimonas sp. TaxID=2060141 RepID=UPI00263ABBEA|nr:CRISPR-associated endonuclease Cas6 [Lunatimonas sp.]MCC5937996.1 hypothetical protein [Lunatimonas sp.]
MSDRIPYTYIQFDIPLHPSQLRKFRGAVIESVAGLKAVFEAAGVASDLFHNHQEVLISDEATSSDQPPLADTHFRYPLIQYKIRHRKAAIFGIGPGAQALQLWMSLAGDSLSLGGEEVQLIMAAHTHGIWRPTIESKMTQYRLNKWLPFNASQFAHWKRTPKLSDRVVILERLIWGHLWQTLDALEVAPDREKLQIHLSTIDWMGFKDSYGIKRLALDVTLIANLNLPPELSIGQGVSIGFGKLQPITSKQTDDPE